MAEETTASRTINSVLKVGLFMGKIRIEALYKKSKYEFAKQQQELLETAGFGNTFSLSKPATGKHNQTN